MFSVQSSEESHVFSDIESINDDKWSVNESSIEPWGCQMEDTDFERELESAILDRHFPDLSNCNESTVLDTALPYIPIYTHLKTYDLKPVRRPSTPVVLNSLRSKFSENVESSRSSKLVTARTGRKSSTLSTPRKLKRTSQDKS